MGVLSLLGLDESGHGAFGVVPAGLAAMVGLVQGWATPVWWHRCGVVRGVRCRWGVPTGW
ncbi:hypothetical protein SVIO_099570 [Streptomyces violaceusniger]|uniref:Uncharacterized protein n=1 Tax=Streptomyces violaceusniger TaxID=68280 RepID=A0A4D4LG26_STRVO|nr:hypothetical protein SVIO_099570 [Streptomyces violaceusniger]